MLFVPYASRQVYDRKVRVVGGSACRFHHISQASALIHIVDAWDLHRAGDVDLESDSRAGGLGWQDDIDTTARSAPLE